MKLMQQQSPQQQGPGVGGSGWSSASSSGLSKAGKSLTMLEMQEAERILKQQQQRAQQQRVSSGWRWDVPGNQTYRHIIFNIFILPAASQSVYGELLLRRAVGRWSRHVGRWFGGERRKRRLVQQHGDVGRGCEEPGRPAWERQQQHGLEEQPQQPLTDVLDVKRLVNFCIYNFSSFRYSR